ncbi:hypothetical protein BDP27DRAFT_1333521 [Rhodocollybia butyracea]|uniref:Uncharacterized protein n=1 Tax=Rhodocollybia butyracea TaxID=206335 RepID=A0A9P5PID8_9AGAR|nr:hypothetical protein BDP27DRAFT_1333521 [Rhodocollybia butyracea]
MIVSLVLAWAVMVGLLACCLSVYISSTSLASTRRGERGFSVGASSSSICVTTLTTDAHFFHRLSQSRQGSQKLLM